MATIRNPTQFNLFCGVLNRSLEAGEILDGLTDAEADEACARGVFERGVLVTAEPDEEDKPKRPVGRPKSVRGAVEVEEVVAGAVETR